MRATGAWSLSSFFSWLLMFVSWAATLGLVLFSAVLVFSLFGPIAQPGLEMDIPIAFRLDPDLVSISAPSLGIDRAEIRNAAGAATLVFPPPNRPFLAFVSLGLIGTLAVVIWVTGELRAVFRTLREGRPFVSANAARLRRVAYAVLLWEAGHVLLGMGWGAYAMSRFTAQGLTFDTGPDISVAAILEGLILLVVAEVFRAGAKLEEDQSLTV